MPVRRRRVLFYSVGRSGIGQTIRVIRLASYLRHTLGADADILIVTGVASGDRLFQSSCWRVVAPAEVVRLADEAAGLDQPNRLTALREAATRATATVLSDFAPDVVVSTSHRGVMGEATEPFRLLRERRCRMVLALRDIYHPPEYVDDFRSMPGSEFDLVLVGGPTQTREWLPDGLLAGGLAPKVSFTGYLRPLGSRPVQVRAQGEPLRIRCQVGGGRDGATVVKAVIDVVDVIRERTGRPVDLCVNTGPLMPKSAAQALRVLAGAHTRISAWSDAVIESPAQDPWPPSVVVSMAGYNSCVEAGWSYTPTVLIAREYTNDLEQSIRAKLFSEWFSNIRIAHGDDRAGLASAIESAAATSTRFSVLSPMERADLFADPRDVALSVLGHDDDGLTIGADRRS